MHAHKLMHTHTKLCLFLKSSDGLYWRGGLVIWQKSKWILIILCNIQCLETKATQKVVKFYYSEGDSLHCAASVLMSTQCALSAGRFHLELCTCIDLQLKLCPSWFTFKSADTQQCVHAVCKTLYRHETLTRTHRETQEAYKHAKCTVESRQMRVCWSPALQCDVFFGQTEGLVIFMSHDEKGRQDGSQWETKEKTAGRTKRRERRRWGRMRDLQSFHVNIV